MKNIKKILMLAVALSVLCALMCVSAFAAEEPTISEIKKADGVSNVTFTINEGAVNFDMTYAGDQDGMFLVLVLGKDTAYDKETGVFAPKAEDILYVNQTTSDDGDVSFTAEGDNEIYPSGIEDESMICLAGAGLDKITLLGVITANGPAGPEYELGDVNRDTFIDATDIAAIRDYILGRAELASEQMILANVTRDESVDANDIASIRDYILGRIKAF